MATSAIRARWTSWSSLTTGLAVAALGIGAAFAPFASTRALAGDGDCCGGGEKKGDGESAGDKTDASKAAAGLLVDLGNRKCPIMGGKPNGKTWSEWNGLRIGHCCGMCPSKFAAEPEKALKQAGIDWKDAAAAVKKVNEAKAADRDKALAELKKKWTVVREPAAAETPAPKGTLIDLANAKCPVMGGDVDGKTYTEWNGLRIGHCCPGCSKKLLADPEKLLTAAKLDWKAAADAAKSVDAAKGADRAKALTELKKKWKVVREPPPEEVKK